MDELGRIIAVGDPSLIKDRAITNALDLFYRHRRFDSQEHIVPEFLAAINAMSTPAAQAERRAMALVHEIQAGDHAMAGHQSAATLEAVARRTLRTALAFKGPMRLGYSIDEGGMEMVGRVMTTMIECLRIRPQPRQPFDVTAQDFLRFAGMARLLLPPKGEIVLFDPPIKLSRRCLEFGFVAQVQPQQGQASAAPSGGMVWHRVVTKGDEFTLR
jgi:hypothetical protein